MKLRMTIHRLAAVLLLLVVGNGLMAADPVLAQEKVVYRLKWLINASTAGDVFALDQGFFSREGLAVAIKAGGPERDALRELELGYAQFGVASADQVIRALAKGASVIVLAQLFQVNPLQWIYRADNFSLTRTQDLEGRTVGITYGGNDETIMRALLAAAGMNENQVRLASVRYDYTPFFENQVPVWPVYRNTQGIFLSDKLAAGGERVAFFDPSQHGVRFVANSVVTSQEMMDQHPETVGRFTRTLLAGWQAAMAPANETAVIQAVAQYDRDTSEVVMRRQLTVTRQMIQPDPGIPVGHIDSTAWQQTEQIMIRQRLIPGPVNVIDRLKTQ
ncbi:ABC transporter substrate-binding protein [uncultured Desulfosarcina sp.]|uniref:ABC transporter substrate-binding protein n=1 Tax=uncultured Desulfosarcina sp. TaxID=218289 RepID=UPI0029C63187|nr:ABC transporter substrate-binding protein [uncultured Desulfosarcina sp.]